MRSQLQTWLTRRLAIGLALAALIAACGFTPLAETMSNANGEANVGADIIVTATPVYKPLAALRGEERFPRGAQLLVVHSGLAHAGRAHAGLMEAGKAELLVTGFAASADANVSFDGASVLFAGKRQAGDPWQIWELTLKDRSVRKVISTASDAERPLYLPGGRMVYAQRTAKGFRLDSAEDGHPLKDKPWNPTAGPGVLPLSYVNASAFPADVLADGRILFEAGFPLGKGITPELYLVYADGSGVESYRCDHGRARWGGTQLASGDVVFTHGASLARFSSALAHEVAVAAPAGEYAGGIVETASGSWLVSARRSAADAQYALYLWQPGATTLRTVLQQKGENLVEPVLLAPRTRPHRHPSGLHAWDFANLLALDARLSREGDLKTAPASVRLETLDAAGRTVVTGTAPVEADGSFFVQTPADKPIRFALLDRKGAVLRRERGWFWVRGGEQRICVGCHTGPERGSENRVPAVLLRSTTPVDLTGNKVNKVLAASKSETPGGK